MTGTHAQWRVRVRGVTGAAGLAGVVGLLLAGSAAASPPAVAAGAPIAGGGTSLANGAGALDARLDGSLHIAVAPGGAIVVAENDDNVIRRLGVSTAGPAEAGAEAGAGAGPWTVSTVAGGVGGPALATTVSIGAPCGLTPAGKSLLVGSTDGRGAGVIRSISSTTDQLSDLAGINFASAHRETLPEGALSADAQFAQSCDVATDRDGNVIFSDSSVVRTGPATRTGNVLIRLLALHSSISYGRTLQAGHIYTLAGDGQFGDTGDGGPATDAEIGIPAGITVDHFGNIIFATAYPTGLIRVVAEANGNFYGQRMTPGNIYTVAGGGTSQLQNCDPGFPDGQLATSVQLGITTHRTARGELQVPSGLRVDPSGNIVFADAGCGDRVQVIAGENAGMFYGREMQLDHIYTIAGGGTDGLGTGGVATNVQLGNPGGIALDHTGNVIIAEASTHNIQVVAVQPGRFYGRQMVAGKIYTLVGGQGAGFRGDGGKASLARLDFPYAVAVDGQGNIAVADTGNDRVRLIAVTNGTFYGRKMQAMHIYTIGGNGLPAYSGDQGAARAATFGNSAGVLDADIATDHAGDVLVLDAGNDRVRLVARASRTIFGARRQAGDIYTLFNLSKTGFTGGGTFDCDEVSAPAALMPCWVGFDHSGNAVLATIRKIEIIAARTGTSYGRPMVAGHLYVVAGGGTDAKSGAPATRALIEPDGLGADSHGDIITGGTVIAGSTGTFFGQHMTAGHVYALRQAGDVQAVDPNGNVVLIAHNQVLVVAGTTGTFYGQPMSAGLVYVVAGDGSTATAGDGGSALAAGMTPSSVTVDAGGDLVIGDGTDESTVRVVATASGEFYGQAMTAGDIYTVAGGGTDLRDGVSGLSAQFDGTLHLAWAGDSILVAENSLGEIRGLSG